MEQLLSLMNSNVGQELIGSITKKTGINSEQATNVVATSLPALLGAIKDNSTTEEGANGLLGALTSGKHNGAILENISGFLGNDDFSDGNKILGHVLGNKQNMVETGISKKTGVDSGVIAKILPMLAPVIMNFLGKQTQNNNVSNNSGLNDMLGGLLGNLGNNTQGGGSILTSLLDQNNDGKLDLSDALSAMTKKEGGLGNLLGGIFGKK